MRIIVYLLVNVDYGRETAMALILVINGVGKEMELLGIKNALLTLTVMETIQYANS